MRQSGVDVGLDWTAPYEARALGGNQRNANGDVVAVVFVGKSELGDFVFSNGEGVAFARSRRSVSRTALLARRTLKSGLFGARELWCRRWKSWTNFTGSGNWGKGRLSHVPRLGALPQDEFTEWVKLLLVTPSERGVIRARDQVPPLPPGLHH